MCPAPPSTPPGSDPDRRRSAVSRGELREATFAGIRWMTFARVLAEASTLGSAIVLARLIPPAEFGRAAIAMIVPLLASVLTFEGFGSALVQRDDLEPRHLETAVVLGAVTGIVLGGVTALAGPLVVTPLFGGHTGRYVQLAAPAFLVAGLAVVPSATLQRRLDFRSVTVAEAAGFSTGAVASVALAIAGLEGEAIVLGSVAAGAVSLILLASAAPWPGVGFDRDAARDLLGFGVPASLQGLTWVATRNIDYIIVGARLGPDALGFYWRAFQLGVEYQGKVSTIMTRVAFPLYSRTEGRAHMSAVHSRVLRVHAVVIFPLLALLIATAPVLVPWLFGARWEPAVLPTQILAAAGMMLALIAGFGQAALASGKPGALVANNLFSLAVYGPTVYFVAPSGLVAVSIAVVCVVLLTGGLAAYILLDRAVGIPLRQLLADAAPATAASAALVLVALPLTQAMDAVGVPAILVLAAATVTGSVTYLVAVRLASPAAWADLRLLLGHLRPRRASPGGLEQPAAAEAAGLD